MSADKVVELRPKITERPVNAVHSEVLGYTTQLEIGFDILPDDTAVAFRRIGDVTGFIPCPDAGSAATILMLMHHEIVNSPKTEGLTWREGFHSRFVEEELGDIVAHYAPLPKMLGENGAQTFDEAFSRDDFIERSLNGLEEILE